jgi:PAS domain S-box-containing protein
VTIVSDNRVSDTSEVAKILIVDDNESLCKSLEMILSKKGYITVTAHSGVEALRKINETDFNLAILDLRLPDMDGTDILDQLNESHPEIAIIVATGYATVESAIKALTNRAVAYVTKPINIDELLKTVSENIERQTLLREKQYAEQALLRSEERYRVLAEESPQGIAIISEDGLIYANKAITEIFGIDLDTLLGMNLETVWEYIHPNDLENLFQKYQEHETRITLDPRVEFRIIRPDGEVRFLEAFATVVEADGKDAIQIIAIDRTSVKKAEETKELHQKEIEIYNSLLRHDLGNDLQVVLGELEFIQLCTSDLTEDAQESLESAYAGAERMYNLVTALRRPVNDIENRALTLIEQIALQSEKAHPGLSISLTPKGQVDNLKIRGSRLLPMVFVNLFSNAIKHAGESVAVDVSISREGNQIVIDIIDDGVGVDPDIQNDLFQRGVSTTGGGLGLYLSKRIIEAIDGSIEYIPQISNGAYFRIRLPLDIQNRS